MADKPIINKIPFCNVNPLVMEIIDLPGSDKTISQRRNVYQKNKQTRPEVRSIANLSQGCRMTAHPLSTNRLAFIQGSAANSTLSLMIRYIDINILLGPAGLTPINKIYEAQADAFAFAL